MLPRDSVVAEQVDRIEVNHVFGGNGALVIDQIIFWDWNARSSRFDVVDWRLLKSVRYEITDEQRLQWQRDGGRRVPPPVGNWRGGHAYPKMNHAKDIYVSEWFDERTELWREVTAPIFLETWTPYDRELVERTILPQKDRRRLRQNCGCKPRCKQVRPSCRAR
jgi:hypothetical protein